MEKETIEEVYGLQAQFKLLLIERFPHYDFLHFNPNLFTEDYFYETFYLKRDCVKNDDSVTKYSIIIKYSRYKENYVHWCLVTEGETEIFQRKYKSDYDVHDRKTKLINNVIDHIGKMDEDKIHKLIKLFDLVDETFTS